MDVDVRKREEQLQTFESFINASYAQIDKIFTPIGWTREYFVKENTKMVCCPLNSEHRVPERSLEKHLSLCSWNREGYHNYDIPFPENPVQNSSRVKTSITLDAALQTEILKEAKLLNPSFIVGDLESDERPIPQTSDRYFADFTADERRVLYEYVVSKTTSTEGIKVEELHLFDDKKDNRPRPKSKLEMLIEERDAKRRRISYRKKVHTNRKTPTEILREVIQNQMELLEQVIKGEENEDKDNENIFDNPGLSKNGKDIHDDSCVRSHDNRGERHEFDGMEERYERHHSRPYSHKRSEHFNRSDEYDSKRRHREYSRNTSESNETKEWCSERTTKHFRDRDSSYEKRFPERHRTWERGDNMYYKRKSHDHSEDEYRRKHKSQSNFKNSEYNYDEANGSANRKYTHATESYQKQRYQNSGPSATSTRDHYYAVPPEFLKTVKHSNVDEETRTDDILEPDKMYEERDDSHKKHKKKKKKHHKHKSKKKHKKLKSSSSSSDGSNNSS